MMYHVLVAVIASLTLTVGTPTAAAKVLGKDTREPIPSEYKQISSGIGILRDTVANSYCTAFCVAPDVIMTNAHCLAWRFKKKGNRSRDVRDFVFHMFADGHYVDKETLAWNQIEPIGNPEASIIFGRDVKGVEKRKANDWAVAKLYRPICAGDVLKIADKNTLRRLSKQKSKLRVFTIGFHSDKRRGRSLGETKYFSRCRLSMRRSGRLAEHDCDTAPWSSGSPIILSTSQGPSVVAIHQGWRGFHRWKRSRGGKKVITRRWAKNYGVKVIELTAKVQRLAEVSLVPMSKKLEYSDLIELLRKKRVLGDNATRPNWQAVQAAIRRYERIRGWVSIGIPTEQLLDDLLPLKRGRYRRLQTKP